MDRARDIVIGSAALLVAGCNDSSLVNIPLANNGPVAVISEASSTYSPLDVATFDGESSYDPDGTIVDYTWTLVERPEGSDPTNEPVAIDGGSHCQLFVDLAGDYRLRLTVRDNEGSTASDDFEFSAVPWQAVHVQLTWNKPHADIDLHMVNDSNSGTFYTSPYDCYFGNPNPNWGSYSGSADDPHLDRDDVEGYGPENINLDVPADGTLYHIYVHSYDADGDGSVAVRIRIYLSGEFKWEGTQNLTTTGKVWNVATISWPEGVVTPTAGAGQIFDHVY